MNCDCRPFTSHIISPTLWIFVEHYPSKMQVMPAIVNVMKEEAALVTLVKPQFEARRSQVFVFPSLYWIVAMCLLFPPDASISPQLYVLYSGRWEVVVL